MLDQLADLKPAGWSFENPLAPGSQATGVTKSTTDYWCVNLRSMRDLSQMQVLYLPGAGTLTATQMNNEDREKLREFVDGGGVLWIDNAVMAQTSANSFNLNNLFFIDNIGFQTGRRLRCAG